MAILVSGGAGYIGSHTCVELLNAGFDIVVADNYYNSCPTALERVYVPTDFDTIEKAFSGVKTAEKGIKQGLSRSNADFGSPCYVCSIGVQMPGIIVDYTPCGVLILQ